jgi:hypothetical protein
MSSVSKAMRRGLGLFPAMSNSPVMAVSGLTSRLRGAKRLCKIHNVYRFKAHTGFEPVPPP